MKCVFGVHPVLNAPETCSAIACSVGQCLHSKVSPSPFLRSIYWLLRNPHEQIAIQSVCWYVHIEVDPMLCTITKIEGVRTELPNP